MQIINSLIKVGFCFFIAGGIVIGCGGGQGETQSGRDTTMSEGQALSQQPMNEGPNEAASMNEGQVYEAMLEGSSEVPAVETEASGTVTAALEGDSLHITGQFSGLSSEYVASHIHKAVEGENGSPIITLEPTVGDDKMSGSWDSTYVVTEDQITALQADSLYINVHSTDHKSGEIRGQLMPVDAGM